MEATLERPTISKEEALKEYAALQALQVQRYEKLKRYKETHGAEYFKPLPHQQQLFDYYFSGKKTLILQGANQSGKTIWAVNFGQANCLGYLPWDKDKKTLFTPPIKVRIICADWEHHAAEVIIPKLYEYLILDEMVKLGRDGYGSKNQIGIESRFQYKNGSTIEIMTNKLDRQAYEGWTGHIILADEPFEKYIYEACTRGLSQANGIFVFTLTSVDGRYDWIRDDIMESTNKEMQKFLGCVSRVHAYKNTFIPKENFDRQALGWDERTRKARLEGEWYSGMGKVWPEFSYDLHVCDEFKIPTDWPVVAMIDYHACIEQAIGFYAVDKPGYKYVIDEVWEKLIPAPEEIADAIIRRKTANAWRLEHAYIDPYSEGAHKMVQNRGVNLQDAYSVIEQRLRKHGIILHVASKDKKSGIENIRGWLRGVNGLPSLRIFRECTRHIYEIKKLEIGENGKPNDFDDHMTENIYRYSLTGTKWVDFAQLNKPYKIHLAACA